MTQQAIFFWLLNLLCDTAGQLSLKAASNSAEAANGTSGTAHWRALARSPWLWVGVSAFVLEFVFWLSFLALVPLAMGLFVGSANVVCVMLGARVAFGEKVTPLRAFAIGSISFGIALVGWGKM
jgi:drug/metabolite transporter (DMT)-like permease